MPSVTRL
ncbi:hypothetical protein YPPY36_1962, partial [Yersinia pestis PY-36]